MSSASTSSIERGGGRAGRAVGAMWKIMLVAGFILIGLAVGGFLNFAHVVTTTRAPADLGEAEAAVVLTGGPARIAAALDLVEAQERRLLISGVNRITSQAALLRTNAGHRATFACCVDLGREALDTVGNAVEARGWAERHGFRHLAVVTSDYHMPRAMLELRRTMPDVTLTPHPVPSPTLSSGDWYLDPGSLRLLIAEWVKYVSAQSTGWFGSELLRRVLPA